ncbi:PH domain-containing protein [Candidatus Woesearchaeota archaeon]|nr:PH domain-containing protein [Candidatus Woesearchaeota archaeon]
MHNLKLPIHLKQTRIGYLHDYVAAVVFAGLGIFLFMQLHWTLLPMILGSFAILFFVIIELHVGSSTLTIDHDKVLISEGILARSHSSTPFHNISDFHTHQGLWERIMGYGTLSITTSGGNEPMEFHKLKRVHQHRDALLHLVQHHLKGKHAE